jgi:hypothetical protein
VVVEATVSSGSLRAAAARSRRVARASFRVAPGTTSRVKLKLNQIARRALRRHTLRATVRITVRTSAGTTRKTIKVKIRRKR